MQAQLTTYTQLHLFIHSVMPAYLIDNIIMVGQAYPDFGPEVREVGLDLILLVQRDPMCPQE